MERIRTTAGEYSVSIGDRLMFDYRLNGRIAGELVSVSERKIRMRLESGKEKEYSQSRITGLVKY